MELKKKGLFIGILLLWLLPLVLAGTEYTPTSETNCNEQGKCTLVQYSGVVNVQEDGEWKNYQSARSLLGKGWDVQYIEEDKDYIIDVIDFNATSVTLNLNPDGIVFLNKEVPLRVWTEDSSKEIITGDFKQDYLKTDETLVDFNILKQSDTRTIDAKLGDIIEFGPNSTTIVLQTANTQNLNDADVESGDPTGNSGTQNNMIVQNFSSNVVSSLVMFNTSALPAGILIEQANLSLYLVTNNYDTADEGVNITTYWIYANYSWNEETLTYQNKPNMTTQILNQRSGFLSAFGGGGEPLGNQTFDVTNLTNYSYLNNEKNVSFFIAGFQAMTTGSTLVSDNVLFVTKEDLDTEQRPMLTITYSLYVPPGGSCTYPGSGDWNINTMDNCTISSNVNLAGNSLILNESGTLVVNAIINNKGSLVMSSGSKIVLGNGAVLG